MDAVERLTKEIIVQILSYLTLRDRKNVALVNKKWYSATVHPMFIQNEIFVFRFSHFDNTLKSVQLWPLSCCRCFGADSVRVRSIKENKLKDFLNTIMASKRTLLNIKFIYAPCLQTITLPLFSNRGLNITSLYFECENLLFGQCDDNRLTDSYLAQIMSQCRNLETLSICNFKIVMETYVPKNSLPKLLFFNLNGSDLSGISFKTLIKHFPNLDTLCMENLLDEDLSGMSYCNMICNLTTASNLKNYLKPLKNITTLYIDVLEILLEIPAQVTLKALKIDCFILTICNEILVNDFINKLYNQKSTLKELEVERFPSSLLSKILVLENLEQLQINGILQRSDQDKPCLQPFLDKLTNMKHLKKLSIWPMYTPDHKKPSYVISQNTLRQLTSLNCFIYNTIDVLNYGKNLLRLSIYNGEILTKSDIHLIFINLTNLKFLQINNCHNLNNDTLSKLPISNLRELITLNINGVKINQQCLNDIKHPNLKFLCIDKILFPPFKLLWCPTNCKSFEASLKMLAFSVPNLNAISLSFIDTGSIFCDKKLQKSYFESLKKLGIKHTFFKMY